MGSWRRSSAVCRWPSTAMSSYVEHLEDLEWVERTARRHEDVLEAALQETTIVPLRLCTLYRDTDGVRRLLREHRAAFRDGLSRVGGCVEWGVKVFADSRTELSDPVAEPAGTREPRHQLPAPAAERARLGREGERGTGTLRGRGPSAHRCTVTRLDDQSTPATRDPRT